jgi:hypothetical protein
MSLKRFGANTDFSPDSLLIMENLGLTICAAQLYEHSLQNVLTGLERLGAITIPPEVTRSGDGFVDACLGNMLRILESQSKMDREMSRLLTKAHYQRNLVAHRFVMENLIDMINQSGRAAVNDKLYNIYLNLRRAHHVVFQLCEQIFAQLGRTPEDIKQELSELRRFSDSSDPNKIW